MNGEIAQLVAIVCYGNALLNGKEIPDLTASNSACQFCSSITFAEAKRKIADDPNQWLKALRATNFCGLRLSLTPRNDPRISDRASAGFAGGGGRWAIETIGQNGKSEWWDATWTVGNHSAADRRIWTVRYAKAVALGNSSNSLLSVSGASNNLHKALISINEFALRVKLEPFSRLFAKALEALDRCLANTSYHRDLYPEHTISQQAGALLNACQISWVFGGMGSWNDVYFERDHTQEYENVSSDLYSAINDGIVVSANDSYLGK